ncbi:MBL fold metallo-hydrolase [Corallococcus exercitus]|uniref:MBL fold metallo-hydrolase n=1 Tax=Corallococcus exercitus TaxID=2316736 RepID=A0A7Y4KJ46_9BACT|nr:MBL fold metallo-hydrolase [Corallococcus exercitus]NOK34753.1 MBL fold metallo-hydrolase [Corallococcus exercitus]
MLRIEMLPAHHGDCLLVSYGDESHPKRILIDGGTRATWPTLRKRIEQLPENERHFELLIVTHIDDDHIGGILKLLQSSQLGVTFGDIWFNGWKHLFTQPPPKLRDWLGPRQGEDLSELLVKNSLPWNKLFAGEAIKVPDSGPLPIRDLDGGLRLTLLSPTREGLEKLDKKWTDTLMSQGIIPGEAAAQAKAGRNWLGAGINLADFDLNTFHPDKAEANGSSIAVLAEHEGHSILLTGDAFAPVLETNLQRLPAYDVAACKLKVDAVKIPHHASKANVSPGLLRLLSCSRYLISTNGDVFEHPDIEAVGRILTFGGHSPELFFNYRSDTTRVWDGKALKNKHGYRAHYPTAPEGGLTLDL